MNKYCFFFAGGWRENANKERLEALANELILRGHQVVIIVDGQRTHLVNTKGNPAFYTWPSPRPTQLQDILFLSRLINRYKPDGLVAQFGSVNTMIITGWLKRVPSRFAYHRTLSTQIIADAKIPNWKIRLLILRKSIVFRSSTHILSNSAAGKQDLIDSYGISNKKIHIFHNSIKDPIRDIPSLRSIPRISSRVVCVGQFRLSKGQDILIRAAALMKDYPGFQIEFVGNGPMQKDYQNLVKELGVENICLFTRGIPHNEVFTKMASSMATVVPSRDEAFGYVNIESMAVGTPVIASNVGGIPEIIRDGLDGYLVPAEDEYILAEKIKQIFSDLQTQQLMSINARHRFLEKFELVSSVKREVDWYEYVAAGNYFHN